MSEAPKPGDLNRRTFLKNLAGMSVGGTLLTACAANQSAAGAGALLRAPLSQRIGLQLYTVRDQLQQDFEGTIARVAQIGYNDLEFAGYYNRTPQQVRQLLDRYKLTAPSSHIGLDQFRNNLQGTIDSAKVIGHEYLTVPSLNVRGNDLETWRGIAAEFNRYGAAVKQAGMKFAYHNHNFEYQAVAGGQTGYDVLLRETDPALVYFEQDLYWTTFAGRDPIELFNRAPHRFPLWHVKDLTTSNGTKAMAPVGQGTIDWKALFAQAQLSGMEYFFVEHDTAAQYPGGSFASIQASYDYLKQLLS